MDGTVTTDAVWVTGSSTVSESVISATPKTGPSAFTVPSRMSAAAMSVRPSISDPQSHNVITRFRSGPDGRGGGSAGASPAATRSVQSARACRMSPSARNCWAMPGPDGPTPVRRVHASSHEPAPRMAGSSSRVALLPTWWQS